MTALKSIAIVGAGLAGAKAAEALRKDGYDGGIAMFGDEPLLPYLRPPLSKDYLRGESELDAVFVRPPASYDEHRIDLHVSTRVKSIEPTAMQLRLDDGSRVAFDRLLLATGASPRKLDIPGSDLAGVHYLRSLEDADAIRRAALVARPGRRRRWRLDRGRGRGLAPSARASCGDDRRGVRPVGARARGRGGRCLSWRFTPSAGSSLS